MASGALDIRIAGRYRLGRKIGSGSFGDIYLGAAPRGEPRAGRAVFHCAGALTRACVRRHPHPDRRGGRHKAGARQNPASCALRAPVSCVGSMV